MNLSFFRPLIILSGLLGLWHLTVILTGVPKFILPSPLLVIEVILHDYRELLGHALITGTEIVLGLLIGIILGAGCALLLVYARGLQGWLMPVLVASQAIPVFALAPVLVLWLGYGMASKIAMAVLIIFFPVTAAFFDGLRQTPAVMMDLGQILVRKEPGARWRVLWHIRIPAALPACASGIRVATAVAPIGAIVGEWVGSSGGLGYLMLHANARMQIDTMFAALTVLAIMAICLYTLVDRLLNHFLSWVPDASRTRSQHE